MSKTADFTQLISKHEGTIFKITAVYTNDRDSQKDLYQEVVLQLWRSYDQFRGDAQRGTWLYRVALNTAISYLRQKKKRAAVINLDAFSTDFTEQRDEAMEDRLRMLYRQIGALDPLDKGLILLYLEDRSYEEMAAITGLSQSNVGTKLSRIKMKLKKRINTEA